MKIPEVILKEGEEKRIIKGHPWIYDNEISVLPEIYEQGGPVTVKNSRNEIFAFGYINTLSKITVRVIDILKKPVVSLPFTPELTAFTAGKIQAAISARLSIKDSTAIRYVNSEADSLPGLVVDMYNKTLVMQINTLGMHKMKDFLVETLKRMLSPEIIYEKSLSPVRDKEGLKPSEGVLWPQGAEPAPVIITENGIKFMVDVRSGSKTGFYIDQRDSRQAMKKYVNKGGSVLDCFCATGGFSLYASRFGAGTVLGIDASEAAVMNAQRNAELNGMKNITFRQGDVFGVLAELEAQNAQFDLIILDPPPFSRAKDEKHAALAGYHSLHKAGLKLLKKSGRLVTFTCSQNISVGSLKQSVIDAARGMNMGVKPLEELYQAKDHPYLKEIPESLYLKGMAFLKNKEG